MSYGVNLAKITIFSGFLQLWWCLHKNNLTLLSNLNLLTVSARTLKNQHLKKANLNGHISKTRTNSVSILWFSNSSFTLLQRSVIFRALYPRVYTARGSASYKRRRCCQPGRVQGADDESGKILNLLFFVYFFWKWAETFSKF